MSQRGSQKARTQASVLVEPGETVRHALPVVRGPFIASGLGLLGVPFLKFRTVALTDEAVYVMTKSTVGETNAVERRVPLGSVEVSVKKGPALNSTLVIGEEKLRVTVPFKKEAEQLAAAASAR